jgi:hypothetical protein
MVLFPPWERLVVEARPVANSPTPELQFRRYFYDYSSIFSGPKEGEGVWEPPLSRLAWKDIYFIDVHKLLWHLVVLVGITLGILGWLNRDKSVGQAEQGGGP